MYCAKCGKENEGGNFCPYCGAGAAGAVTKTLILTSAVAKKKKTVVIAISAVALIVVVVLIVSLSGGKRLSGEWVSAGGRTLSFKGNTITSADSYGFSKKLGHIQSPVIISLSHTTGAQTFILFHVQAIC